MANLGAVPSTDDVVFKGTIANWIATAYTLKARYSIQSLASSMLQTRRKKYYHICTMGPRGRGIQNNSTDAQVVFGASTTNANPIYQQNTNRPG